MATVTIRNLRNEFPKVKEVVEAEGEVIVTDNGRPVARLVPLPPDVWQALIDSGQVIPAELPGGLLDIEPRDFGIDASAELAAMRALEDR